MASILRNQRITAPDHFQDTRHIELDLGRSGIVYDPGDLLTIFPRQPSAAVQEFIQCTGLDGSAWVEITPCEVPPGMAQSPSMQVGLQRERCSGWLQKQSSSSSSSRSVTALSLIWRSAAPLPAGGLAEPTGLTPTRSCMEVAVQTATTPSIECLQPLPSSMHCFGLPHAWLIPCLH